ncbi:MAG: glycosyltransferase family 2 protein [Candidatus Diapherotrites archaeon]|uniref:Glycosyltransferase family 2 protein n=1 Tax=Candidatus Iainarchaeum sp. TaxID=3101447 RepID=A0A8T4L7L2_9ARCH|nr:glycosyltransferase family 2 protein [Candidatus Diapherotrites archaeon]
MAKTSKESVSFFFPAYFDEKSIPGLVEDFNSSLSKSGREFEIIVVDDCSPDNTGKVADRLAKKFENVRVVHHKKNRGYGGALKSGLSSAKKELIGFTDGDAQFTVEDFPKFLDEIMDADLVIGYRTKRAEGFRRHIIQKCYSLALLLVLSLNVKDPDCAFKLVRRKALNGLTVDSNSGFFSAEFIYRAKKNGLRIKEVPVRHLKRKYGTSRCIGYGKIIETIADLIKFRINTLR